MGDNVDLLSTLRTKITDEIVVALGFNKNGLARKILGPFFYPPAQTFSRLFVETDHQVGENGAQAGARQLLAQLTDRLRVFGEDLIPREGPLVVASNHPGGYDSVALLSRIPRPDIRVIVSNIPFLRNLPHISQYLIFAPPLGSGRMLAVRQALRHLNEGGALLIFPTGLVDPDPAILPGAKETLADWFSSLGFFLRHAPLTRLVLATVSGVLAPEAFRSPLTRLVHLEWQKRKLAEFIQIIQTVLFGNKFGLNPAVSFGAPLEAASLLDTDSGKELRQQIQLLSEQQLEEHIRLAGLTEPIFA